MKAKATNPKARRKGKDAPPEGAEHYAKAFESAVVDFAARNRLANEDLSSSTRKRLENDVLDQTDRLKRLTERDRGMTRLLAEYSRQHGGEILRLNNTIELQSYQHFIDWGREWCIKQGDKALASELTEADLRTTQYRLQNQFGAKGEPGRKRNKAPG